MSFRRSNSISARPDETLYSYLVSRLDYLFFNSIPVDSVKELPKPLMYTFGAMSFSAIIVTFFYFIATTYQTTLNRKFISLEASSGECSPVLKPVTGLYLASTQGLWEGQTSFNYNAALYSFQLSNLEMNQSQFSVAMSDMAYQINYTLGAITQQQNLAVNLAILMTTVLSLQSQGETQLVSFTGDPGVVFNRINTYTFFSKNNVNASNQMCYMLASTKFDSSSATFAIAYNYETFAENCSDILDPQLLGYFPFDGYNAMSAMSYSVDMRSFITAFGVNIGSLSLEYLEIIPPSSTITTSELMIYYNNATYTVMQLYDIRYPGMKPIICLYSYPSMSLFLCFIEIETSLYLPLFNHLGNNWTYPEYCDCDTNGQEPQCHEFDLMISMLYFNQYDEQDEWACLLPIIKMYSGYKNASLYDHSNPYLALNRDAYQAQFWAFDIINPAAAGSLDFCGFNCSMMTIYADDYYNQAVSDYYFQLTNGSCSNLFSSTLWSPLIATPPTSLTEQYYSCASTHTDAFLSALGLAFADTSALVAVMPLFFIPLIYFALKALGYPAKHSEFDDVDRKLILEEFANELLVTRELLEGDMTEKQAKIKHIIKAVIKDAANGLKFALKEEHKSHNDRQSEQESTSSPITVEMHNI